MALLLFLEVVRTRTPVAFRGDSGHRHWRDGSIGEIGIRNARGVSNSEFAAMQQMSSSPSATARSSALPAGVRARVWIEARHFFSRADAQSRCWLWFARDDGQVRALLMPSHCLNRDELLADLVRIFDAGQEEEFLPGATQDARALPDAPIVPVPRWQISWGHPVQRAIREFAASLDHDVLQALGDLETPGPFFGSVANYNRLISLAQPFRLHRLQALAGFPPLVAPMLLEVLDRPDMFGNDYEADRFRLQPRVSDEVLHAIDFGRDLIGALAASYRVDRALVRSPLCRSPWASGAIPTEALRLFAALPARARPRHANEAEPRLQHLKSLALAGTRAHEIEAIASAFAQGWNETWARLEIIGQPLQTSLHNTRDFLDAAVEQVAMPESLAGMSRESLGLAWVARRGLESLLLASKRWHAQALEELPVPAPAAPRTTLERAVEEIELEGGSIQELLTESAMIEEGERMHHCVADYWTDCLTEGTRIVHLQLPDGERATAEYGLHGGAHDPYFSLEQLLGPCNATVSATMDRLADDVLGLLNAPAQHERRKRVADSAHAAMCEARDQPTRRRTIRRLDLRSRHELAQVVAWCQQQNAWKQRRGELFRGCVAGFQYADGARVIDRLQPGDALVLAREPDNAHDRYAVRVDWRGRRLGYIPRGQNRNMALLLDAGTSLDAHIVAVNRGNEPWTQLEIRVERVETNSVQT